ncbi:MAG: SMC-Scp complex subunit ScpB [Anaerolineales bacterium]|jgi:segregation and condensation protein B
MSTSDDLAELSLSAQIEALLFVAVEPVSTGQLATVLETTSTQVNNALDELDASFRTRGLRLQRHNGRVQMTTAPETSEAIERFLGLEATTHLSRAALEALSIIAYQQPVTRPQVDSVRGVNSDGVMRTLLSKGLIQEGGRAEGPGRPILYSTTPDFLQHFGLNSLTELPPLERLESGEQDVSLLKG